MYNCILFDMDGTLVDSYPGISRAYQAAFEKMGRAWQGNSFVRRAIGAPLPFVFRELCGMSEADTLQAVSYYRAYYEEKGRHELGVYPGMEETLRRLKGTGRFLGTATLKKEKFAKEILEEQGLLCYFDAVCGMDEGDRFTKSDLIRRCMEQAKAEPRETILVGDSEFDAEGARQAGVEFLAVTYGFGFQDKESWGKRGIHNVAESPSDIWAKLEEVPVPQK